MIAYKTEKTADGVLCALFESFTQKEKPVAVFSGDFQLSIGCDLKVIKEDSKKALRVRNGILKCGGISLLSTLFKVLRCSDGLALTTIFNCAYKCLEARKDLTLNFADPDIYSLYELGEKLGKEIHNAHGFLRFELAKGGYWYAHFAPDNDIVDLVAPHFRERFPNEKFVIHDVKRNVLTFYDGQSLLTVKSDVPVTIWLDDAEIDFQSLWQTYFKSVAIESRTNPKLQDGWLPRRYRKHMCEFQNLGDFN